MRGKVEQRVRHQHFTRITPACAGKSKNQSTKRRMGRDHPRVCGEKRMLGTAKDGYNGSPPRVRGKEAYLLFCLWPVGITPACAGKRLCLLCVKLVVGDHPRVCGEKCRVVNVLVPKPGSPPRVRGKECGAVKAAMISRITPACAGKSISRCLCALPKRDHPRVCGEKSP